MTRTVRHDINKEPRQERFLKNGCTNSKKVQKDKQIPTQKRK